jgi:hypothetical protein
MAALMPYSGRQAGSWCSCPHSIARRRAENGILVAIAAPDDPGQRLNEANGAAVRDARRLHTRDMTAHDASTDLRELAASFDLQLDLPSGQKANRRFDQCTTCRDIDDCHLVSGTHAGLKNAEFPNRRCPC